MKLYQGTARFIYIYIYCSGNNSGYFTCKQNMKLVTNKFKSVGLHEKHVVSGNLECWEPSEHLLIDTGKPEKPVSMWPVAGPSEY